MVDDLAQSVILEPGDLSGELCLLGAVCGDADLKSVSEAMGDDTAHETDVIEQYGDALAHLGCHRRRQGNRGDRQADGSAFADG